MLLAAFGARRPTADADALARRPARDPSQVLNTVVEIAAWPVADDGVAFDTSTAGARTIREQAQYAGVRVTMNAALATATVPFRLDVSFGDPVVPGAQRIELPALRPIMPTSGLCRPKRQVRVTAGRDGGSQFT